MNKPTLKSEQAIIKAIGGTPHYNSGRGLTEKGDGHWSTFTIDVKESKNLLQLMLMCGVRFVVMQFPRVETQ